MGVMMCDRGNCENVCCDYYSDVYGYLCRGCFDELCSTVEPGYINIENFMVSSTGHNEEEAQRAYFEAIFWDRTKE